MIDITIKNYRCFTENHPVRLSLRQGFTAFIGVNNSGKSALLRFFYEMRELLGGVAGDPISRLRSPTGFNVPADTSDRNQFFSKTNTRPIEIAFEHKGLGLLPDGRTARTQLTITIGRDTNMATSSISVNGHSLTPAANLNLRGDGILEFGGSPQCDFNPIHEALRRLTNTLYIGPFRNVINVGGHVDYFDIRIGQQFVEEWREHKSGPNRANNEAAYALTKEIERLFGFKSLEINPTPDGQALQVVINGKSFALNEVGGGVSQFIVVLANAAIRRPRYILIDEPESNLHPSLQIDFLTTLGSYAERGVMFSTHNIGLARACAEQLYAFRRVADFETNVTPYEAVPRLSEFLGELSFGGYQQMGFDKVLLVEGPSDVKAIQQILRLYGKEHQFVLLPLGGGTLINAQAESQLQEVKRISPNVAAIIDSEVPNRGSMLAADRQGFFEACKRTGVDCHILERRAFENYLSDRAVKAVKGPKYRALQEFERLRDAQPSWGKDENWRIVRTMTKDEWSNDLGDFISRL